MILVILVFGCSDKDINSSSRTGLSDPNFQYISPDWIPQYNKMSMRSIWLEHGIDRDGFSYYFLPKAMAPNTCSERFNPLSKYFQSWFGVYTISDNSNGVYAIQDNKLDAAEIIRLGIADQEAWIHNFAGLNIPTVFLDSSYTITVENNNGLLEKRIGW